MVVDVPVSDYVQLRSKNKLKLARNSLKFEGLWRAILLLVYPASVGMVYSQFNKWRTFAIMNNNTRNNENRNAKYEVSSGTGHHFAANMSDLCDSW